MWARQSSELRSRVGVGETPEVQILSMARGNGASSMNAEFERVTITRQQAARQEIETAIELLFDDGSPVAIEVLTWAAVEMMRGIAEHRGIETFQAKMEISVVPKHLREWRQIMKGHYNYFKHGDRDPERVADEFRPEAVTFSLFGACNDYQALFGKTTLAMYFYVAWFLGRHPDTLMSEARELPSKIAEHLDHPQDKPYRESLKQVSELYQSAKRQPRLVLKMLGDSLGDGFEP